jgi:hypothetical protein
VAVFGLASLCCLNIILNYGKLRCDIKYMLFYFTITDTLNVDGDKDLTK